MQLLQGDIIGIISLLIIFSALLFVLSHLPFAPFILKALVSFGFSIWLTKQMGISLPI